jgi:hypothetical protein
VSRLAPDERVRMVFQMQASVLGMGQQPLARVVTIRRLAGEPCASPRAVKGPA